MNSFPANLFVWMKKLVLDNGFVFLLTLPLACSLQKWQVAWMFVSFYSLSVDDLPDLKVFVGLDVTRRNGIAKVTGFCE